MATRHVYTVIEADNLAALIDKVNGVMRDGWRAKGGVCCVQFQNPPNGLASLAGSISYRFLQAMEKRESGG